jgi:hypothetical protein
MKRRRASVALVLMAGVGLFMVGVGPADAEARSTRAHSIGISLSLPVSVGVKVRVSAAGRVTRAPRGADASLERRSGTSWVRFGRAIISRGRFKIAFAAPSQPTTLQIRAVILKGRRRLATSRVFRLTVVGSPSAEVKGFGPVTSLLPAGESEASSPAPALPAPPEPSPKEPASRSPIAIAMAPVGVSVGTLAEALSPEPLVSITTITGVAGGEPGVSATVAGSGLGIAASSTANTGSMTLILTGTGCTPAACEEQFLIRVPVTVAPIAAPPGALEALTQPSPDRTAAAVEHVLTDELVITVGSPEAPGTRTQAEAAATAVEAAVSGGLEASGIYQVRWPTPQDLGSRTAALEAKPAVTSVSDSSVGLYEGTSMYPVATAFDVPQWTWPYEQVHASQAWEKATGSNVTVGVIDVGDVYTAHEDLNVSEVIGTYSPAYHATHVAGLACAKNNEPATQVGMVGLAWGCPIVSDTDGSTHPWTLGVLAAMHAMASRPRVGVVNISLGENAAAQSSAERYDGGNCADDAFQADLGAKLEKEGAMFRQFLAGPEGQKIVWTFSAGNNCAPGTASPWGWSAELPNVVTTAATNSDKTLASFSNYGPGVEVAAPGGISVSPKTNGLKSTATDWDCPEWESCPVYCFYTISYCGTYGEDSGTSMAAPVVAGIAALVRSKNPQLSADEAGTCITATAGTAGVGYAEQKSALPFGDVYKQDPDLPQNDPIPIVNAAAAVECAPRGTASSYSGSGGGDGWAVALSQTSVFNVFHHDPYLQFACHFQADASPCYAPETITDSEGDGFASSGHPGIHLNQNTGKLYVFATRTSDDTGGVVCVDINEAASNPDPFCGFTPLTSRGEAPLTNGISAISDPTLVGARWYAFNYADGSEVTGDENKLLCFDFNTSEACPDQPFAVTNEEGNDEDGDFPPPAVTAIGTEVIVPLRFDGSDQLACLDGDTEAGCDGSWPIHLSEAYDSYFGAAFPMMESAGFLTGFCLPNGTDSCFNFQGTPVSTPSGMTEAIPSSSGWNGPALVIGTRVYVPNGDYDQVDCYNYDTSERCPNFPKSFENLDLLYTVNADPERPHCIWVNSDNGSGQIQNFDAYTGRVCE